MVNQIMQLDDYRGYPRTFLGVPSTEFTDALVDVWILEAVNRVLFVAKQWPFLEETETVNVLSGTGNYSLSTVALDRVNSISGEYGNLTLIEHSDAQHRYSQVGGSGYMSGVPVQFSIFEDQIHLWPVPDNGDDVTVYGMKPLADWYGTGSVGSATVTDLPNEFGSVILDWIMYRAHQHQDDFGAARERKNDFEEGLNMLAARILGQADEGGPMVVGGGSGGQRTHAHPVIPRP